MRYVLWLPLAAAVVYWYLSLSLMRADQTIGDTHALIADLAVSDSPVHSLIELRRALPHLQRLGPPTDSLTGLSERIREYESMSLDASRASAGRGTGDATIRDAVGTETRNLIRVLDQHAARLTVDADRLWQQMMTLIVVMTLGAVGFAGLAVRRHRVDAIALTDVDRAVFAHTPGPAVLSDASDVILAANDAYCRLTGYREDELVGRLSSFNHSRDFVETEHARMKRSLAADGVWKGELWLRKKSGEAVSDQVLRRALYDRRGDVSGFVTLSTDAIGGDEESRLKLWQAHHDTLTKLPNRNLLNERLSRNLITHQGLDSQGAVISVDIDRFKVLNESIGVDAGDQLLMEMAVRLAMSARESDTVARLGSDQFVIMMADIRAFSEAERTARDILERMREAFIINGHEVFVTASIGVVMFPADGDEPGDLLHKADAARAQVKAAGGDGVAFFEPEINDRATRRLELEMALRKAIANDELSLHYQPVIGLKEGSVVSCEALLRWQHPEMGMISPGEFIPVAEDSGLIIDVGQWVLKRAQQQLAAWREVGIDISMSLNVSVRQLRRPEDVEDLLSHLASGGARGLTLELTESAFVDNRTTMQTFINRVRDMGASVALDDFGTGYSSLSYLRDFRFDTLKIDKSFVDHLVGSATDLGLVASIVSMGRILGMRVVAEGVETIDQVDHLGGIGCDLIQGYYFSKPLEVDAFTEFVMSFSTEPVLEASARPGASAV